MGVDDNQIVHTNGSDEPAFGLDKVVFAVDREMLALLVVIGDVYILVFVFGRQFMDHLPTADVTPIELTFEDIKIIWFFGYGKVYLLAFGFGVFSGEDLFLLGSTDGLIDFINVLIKIGGVLFKLV